MQYLVKRELIYTAISLHVSEFALVRQDDLGRALSSLNENDSGIIVARSYLSLYRFF